MDQGVPTEAVMSTLALLFFPLAMALAASSDLLTMRISNKLVIVLAAGFLVVALLVEMPLQQFLMHLLCAAVVLAVAFGLFAMRLIGGGDAKLAAATTLWLGFGLTLPYLAYTAILGGVLTLIILLLRRVPINSWIVAMPWLARLHDRKQGVPYGIAMALAGLLVYSNSAIFDRLAG
jgi:prepilin peptidase CpaA